MNVVTPSKVGGYVTPKGWSEISSDEKIERMREIIKNLQIQVTRCQVDCHRNRTLIAKHSHDTQGKPVQEVKEYDDNGRGELSSGSSSSAVPYF